MSNRYKHLAILTALVLLTSALALATQVNAQPQDNEKTTPISGGKYVNSGWGVEIVFPEGWMGTESVKSKEFLLASVNFFDASGGAGSVIVMSLNIWDKAAIEKATKEAQGKPVGPMPDCKNAETSDTTISGMAAKASVDECTMSMPPMPPTSIKSKTYSMETQQNKIYLTYTSMSSSDYDQHIAKFEESVKTFKYAGAVGIKTESPKLEMKSVMQKVKVAGNDIDLKIDSSSGITDFAFSEQDKQISFKVSGDDGTEGTTVIQVSRVLLGPYTVMFDGKAMTNFETMKDAATGETSIKLTYTHSTRDIRITGTTVVPEFSAMVAIVMAVSIMMIVVMARLSGKQLLKLN